NSYCITPHKSNSSSHRETNTMQGYTWSSNQRPSPRCQDRPPPQYQERFQPQYQERPPPQYQERFQPPYQERPPPQYHAARNDQPNAFQGQRIPQPQTTLQGRYSNGQQEAANQWRACSGNGNSSAFLQNGYNWLQRTNQMHAQYQNAPSQSQQHYPSDNPNAYRFNGQIKQWQDCSPQIYRNTDCSQAQMYWSPQSDNGSSVGNNRGWSSHNSNNGNSCSMNNQQQLQPARMAPPHHHHHHHHHHQQQQQQQQQQFSKQYSGKKHRRHTQPYSQPYNIEVSQKISNSQAQSRTEASHTSCNSTTPPSGAKSNVSLPSNNLNQSPANHNQLELGSNTSPDISANQSQKNAGHQSQDTNNGTYNVNQTSQMMQTSEAQLQCQTRKLSSYVDSLIYRLLCSDDKEQANKQQSDERIAQQNTHPKQSEVCATSRTDSHSFREPSAQCTVEPPSKRIKYAVIQRDCWNKDKCDFGVQSSQPGTHRSSSNENRCKEISQHVIQYSTDPADCLEAVFALQKAAQQSHKAIAIVPPISQQTSNTAQTDNTSPKKAESPPLKIDYVWSLVEESNEQKNVGDKLSESSTQMAQQENKSLENMTESNIEDPDVCSASPVEGQNDVQQSQCVSSDPSFDLSTVPVTEYTLEKLKDLVKSVEMAELSAGCPEKSGSFFKRVLKLFWNGKVSNMLEALKSFREIEHLSKYAKDYESVVFKSIEPENLKKLAHCDILRHDAYLSPEEFRSSWLNVDGQPADIEKVLSEPLLDDVTMFKSLSDNTVVASASLSVNSHTDMPEVSSKEKSVNPDTCSPKDVVMQKEGNDREEVAVENNGHSEGEKETFKTQEDMNQNQKPSDISPSAERSKEKLTDLSNAKEAFRQDSKQTRDNVSDSLSPNPGDGVSDGAKNSEVSTETHCNSMDTWQVEDISDDETPGNKEALNNSSNNWLVEDISDDENPGSNETVNNTSGTWLVEDISDDEDSGNKEAVLNSSNALEVEDISKNENPVVEDVSTDETSSSDSMFMGITVLSSEDAKTFFHQFEMEPAIKTKSESNFDCFDAPSQPDRECNKATTCSSCGTEIVNSTNLTKMDSDADLFCLQCWEQAPLFELEEEPSSPMTDEADLLASPAKSKGLGQSYILPCLKLEVSELTLASTKECIAHEALKGEKSDCLVKSEPGEDCSTPSLKIEVREPTVAPNEECIADEQLAGQESVFLVKSEQGRNCSPPSLEVQDLKTQETCTEEEQLMRQKRDSMVKSELVENCSPPSLELKVKKPTVASTKECIADEGLAGQKSVFLVKLERGHNCSPPSLEVKVLKTQETCIEEEQLTGQKRDSMVKSELVEKCSPSFELKVKKSVASMKECIADEGQKSDCMMQSELRQNCQDVKTPKVSSPEECIADEGPKRDIMAKSEMGENRSSPSLELKVNKSNFALLKACVADEGLIGQKSDCMGESELGENHSPPCLKLEVKESTIASAEDCIADKGLTREKNDGMPKPAERELTEIQPNKQKNTKKPEKIRVHKPQSLKQCSKPFPKNTAFSKHKLKSGSTSTGSDDSVLFTPDVVVKINCPRKRNPPGATGNKRRSSESQKCNKVKKFKEHRHERRDNPDTKNQRENPTEKVSGQSNDAPPHGLEKKLELH
ncbi:hypothetical protein M9458_009875, partial [Cirrhinus mrigala]